jgi:predicted O-methyltransferase YrrM
MTWAWSGEPGMDLHEALRVACRVVKVQSYLEIGVDGGGSLNTVLCEGIPKRIVLCDLWDPTYCDHGDSKARVLGILDYFKTTAEFLDGDSKVTVPTLRGLFDLVLVDADHSALGARIDLQNAWPRVRPGGVLVMDDINHPDYPWLTDVWARAVEEWGMWVIPETHGGCNAAIALK